MGPSINDQGSPLAFFSTSSAGHVMISVGGGRSATVDESIAIEARALREEDLPVFTVLVPMFREARMLPMLAQSLRSLDYPLGKLDIKIVLWLVVAVVLYTAITMLRSALIERRAERAVGAGAAVPD